MAILINKYIEESDKAREILSEKLSFEISSLNFQIALASHFNYSEKDSIKIINHKLVAVNMIEILKNYNWNVPVETEEVLLETTIIPKNLPSRIDEQKIKNNGEIWVIHKNDKDPFPSNPHAHNYAGGYKLHLGSGQLYDNKNNDLGQRISKKDLELIRSKLKNIALPS